MSERSRQIVAGAVRSEGRIGPPAAGQDDGGGRDSPAVGRVDDEPGRGRRDPADLESRLDRDAPSFHLELQDLENGRGLVRRRIDAAALVGLKREAKSFEEP
jgi:hypothetical protein